MADHDRDAGSRGEEEAPRDPTPGDRPGAPHDADAPPPDPDSTDGPHHETITAGPHHENAVTTPGRSYSDQPGGGSRFAGPPGGAWATGAPPPPPRSDSFRDFIRQKPAQIIGAGLIGLIIGGVLGGGAVAAIGGVVHRREAPRVYWQGPAWERYPGYQDCRPVPGGTYCGQQPPYVNPRMAPRGVVPTPLSTMAPSGPPTPLPTMLPTGSPTPLPTKTD